MIYFKYQEKFYIHIQNAFTGKVLCNVYNEENVKY